MRSSIVVLPLTSFVIILASLYGFAEIADGIGPNDDLHLFDQRMAEALRIDALSATHAFFAAATHLGSGVTLSVMGVAVGVALLLKRELASLYAWIIALGGSGLLNYLLKQWFERARPGDVPLLTTWSFPSGHAMNSLVAYGMLVYLLARAVPPKTLPVIIASAAAIVMVVGASRIFLYYHYFSDVVGGFAAGLAWLTVCITTRELAMRPSRYGGISR